jgi:5-methylcytosine-specific restriction enzyme subunit McrC
MLWRCIREYGRLSRDEIGPQRLRELQRFDEKHAGVSGQTIFDWDHLKDIRAKNFVGVVQVPGLVIEILPKIDEPGVTEESDIQSTDVVQARQNLMFMLSVSGHFSLFERDLASQSVQSFPVLEAWIWAFVRRLLTELRRGQQHLYVAHDDNLTCVKGKILLQKHCTVNAAHHHRMYVAYDEFECDTWLNRILKAACLKLLSLTRLSRTEQFLREALLELADVDQQVIRTHHFDLVRMDRNSERFRELLDFCRLLFSGMTPEAQAGETPSFSLLFPMETVFEEFIGAILKRHADDFGFLRSEVHLQAQGRTRWLLRQHDGPRRFQLKPDVLIEQPEGIPAIILDTKWKRLVSSDADAKYGVSQGDIYQLYAYAHRFQCRKNVLLFPEVPGAVSQVYELEGNDSGAMLKVAFVNLNYDLRKNSDRLIENLKTALAFP